MQAHERATVFRVECSVHVQRLVLSGRAKIKSGIIIEPPGLPVETRWRTWVLNDDGVNFYAGKYPPIV